jgi:hypothetical protein
MARATTGRGKKARKKKEKKKKVAVSPKPQARTAPFVPDTTSWDVANEVARRQRSQIAATAAQPPMSPSFPGNAPPPPQVVEAVGSAAGTGAAVADATVITAYDQMLARLETLEATMAQLPPPPPPIPGIGHNNPPPDPTQLDEIKRDIALLKAQPPPAPAEANNIASKFVSVAGRVFAWFGKHLDTAIEAFMKASGKAAGVTAGTALALSPIWLIFGHQLTDAAAAIMQWLMTLPGLGQ